jgi:DNA repair and recombination protein RAD54 and RAD54-like protein
MRQGTVFIAKPLHDPSGEFAIVLYDPTIDDKPPPTETDEKTEEEEKPKLDVPIMHRSLADILGLKKKVEEHKKIPVVIDPRLTKVLRPHQVEGVKVKSALNIFQEFVTLTIIVPLPVYNWFDRPEGQRMYHGR